MVTQLQEKTIDERYQIYNILTSACNHLYSKNKLQVDKFNSLKELFVSLTKEDPIFMAHLTAWASKKDSKDLQVLSVYFNALSDADGQPYFEGATATKPNLRLVSDAVIQSMSPHIALRVLELSRLKFGVKGKLDEAAHYPTHLKNAFRKYILYRESNLQMLKGIKSAGLANKMTQMYRLLHMTPTNEAASILGWKQRNRTILMDVLTFENKSTTEIVKIIKDKKLSPTVAIPALGDITINAKIAKALLENCTGNQAVILQNLFRSRGFLEIPEIAKLFVDKVSTATTAIDRIDTLSKNVVGEEKEKLSEIRSKKRKEVVGNIGKVFIHIDTSGSMQGAIAYAKEYGSIFAECITDPEKNFAWGNYEGVGYRLKLPTKFTKEGFHESLYGVRAGGSTDCLALYEEARKFGADVDIHITDQGHTNGNMLTRLENYHRNHPSVPKPRAIIVVDFGGHGDNGEVATTFRQLNVPVVVVKPTSLTESALVAQAVQTAIRGQVSIIDEILETELPSLPRWYVDSSSMEQLYKAKLKEQLANG